MKMRKKIAPKCGRTRESRPCSSPRGCYAIVNLMLTHHLCRNNKAPMPELIISPSSTGMSFVPPPPAAYQPTMRILKRPSPSQSASNSTASLASQTRNTLAEREAQYQEARNRIFGATNEGCGDDLDSGRRVRSPKDTGGKGADAGFAVLRTPLGPSDAEQDASTSRTDGTPPKGFRERKNGRNQSISSSSISQRT
jgi:hypothetical protein